MSRYFTSMDASPPEPGTGPDTAPSLSVDPALRTTVVSDGAQPCTNVSGRPFTDPDIAPARDLVAELIYYQSNRDLFGAADPPPTLGKYVLERLLGTGAFGAVILGHNPDTGGEVAIKILRTVDPRRSEKQARRLEREAQALARLAHPNIVPVYDAGVAGEARYVVMRRVSGATLRDAQKDRRWQDIVDLYVAAGRGLAAVHAAGLVHRDFKADNVLVGDDGQVMLADFGLVHLIDRPDDANERVPTGDLTAFAAKLSNTGEVFGTPAYMAPETFEHAPIGPSSDIFSFAAALYEALYGALPFAGATPIELYVAASQDQIRSRPDRNIVPDWLDTVVRGALRADPRQRPASIDALLDALDYRAHDHANAELQARRYRRRWIGGGLTVAAACGLAVGAALLRPPDPCAAPETRLASAWTDRRAGLQSEVDALGAAPDAWTRVRGLLDAYATAWADTYGGTCRATFHAGEQSEELFDARVACLDQRRRELAALVDHLRPVSHESIARGLDAAARLDGPAACASVTRVPTPTERQRGALSPVQDAIADAHVRELAGDYAGAETTSTAAVRNARAVGFAPTLAEALIAHGRALWLRHDGQAARAALDEAVDVAEAAALDGLAADAGNLLIKVAATELRDAARGDEWARQTERKLARIDADPWRRAELLNNRGLLAFHVLGKLDAAVDLHRRALAVRERFPGEARLLVAASHENLANALAARGDLAEALQHYAESARLDREVLGDDHPKLFDDAYNRAVSLLEARHYPEAAALAEEALAGYLRVTGPRADAADAHILLATILEQQRQLTAGREHAGQAAAILTADPGASPGKRAIALERLGSLEREAGEFAAALSTYDRGLAALGDDRNFAAERVSLLVDRASALLELQRSAEAARGCEQAIAAADPTIPALARYRAAGLRCQGRVLLRANRPGEARGPLEEALAILETSQDPPAAAEVRFLLAQSLAQVGAQRPRALVLAHEALEYYRSVDHQELIQEILAWIHANQPSKAP